MNKKAFQMDTNLTFPVRFIEFISIGFLFEHIHQISCPSLNFCELCLADILKITMTDGRHEE